MTALINDKVWGEFEVTEPVLVDLLGSEPVQRLKSIHQAGASYYIYPEMRPVTRFEHSVGVMRLLQLLGASVEEQVAGLLHDVPHTAFSHTVDALFPSDEHNFHERFQQEIILKSEIPAILQAHGVPLYAALEPHRFGLLERPLPDLCADRIDYALRDTVTLGGATVSEALHFVRHLVPAGGTLAVDDVDVALWFARIFVLANSELYTSVNDAGGYWALAGALRRAIEIGAFDVALLFTTDDQAMEALLASSDEIVRAYLQLLKPGTHFYIAEDKHSPGFVSVMKHRRLDPLVLSGPRKEVVRLSALVPEYARTLRSLGSAPKVVYRLWTDSMPPLLANLAARGLLG